MPYDADHYDEKIYPGDIKVQGVVGYCNGLVCLSCFTCREFDDSLYLWNPATRKATE